jgi:hypothetical protein
MNSLLYLSICKRLQYYFLPGTASMNGTKYGFVKIFTSLVSRCEYCESPHFPSLSVSLFPLFPPSPSQHTIAHRYLFERLWEALEGGQIAKMRSKGEVGERGREREQGVWKRLTKNQMCQAFWEIHYRSVSVNLVTKKKRKSKRTNLLIETVSKAKIPQMRGNRKCMIEFMSEN